DTATEIKPGTLVAVNNGTANANTSWLETATVVTVDTDPVLFSQFTFAPTAFLMVANNLSDVANVATSRTNLGLGTVATKTASDNAKTNAVMLDAAPTIGHLAVFTDVNGTIGDGGVPANVLFNFPCNGRITLNTGVPVTTTNVTAATTIYFTPYAGNQIALWDGALWNTFSFTELSIAVPGTTSTMYDLFIYDNVGTPTLETQTWTNDTTRAVSLAFQDGVYVKTSDHTRRYLGSFRTTTVVGQTEDSTAKRYVWNYYNRINRPMSALEATATWNYTTAAWRQANNSTANQLDFICGVPEDVVECRLKAAAANSTATIRNCGSGIGVDSTTVPGQLQNDASTCTNSTVTNATAYYQNTFTGRHFLAWLEYGGGGDTTTWIGTKNTPTFFNSGLTGNIWG
ncbi:MAG TPA: hypothetical protein VFO37_00700, partial [Chitinophagaceae bacterium]|nr:hypothetical protein [Chitinophagaceae bacterium]